MAKRTKSVQVNDSTSTSIEDIESPFIVEVKPYIDQAVNIPISIISTKIEEYLEKLPTNSEISDVPNIKYSPIPYASQWELNDNGRPVGILPAIGKMMMGWRNLTPDSYPYRRDMDTPDQVLIQTYLHNLGLESTIQYPLFYGDILQGDICLINYSGFSRDKIQDKPYHNWTWVVFIACDGKTVTVHDPNWGGKDIEGGKLLQLSIDEWKEIFQAHNRGYTVVRLVTHGVREGKVEFPPEPLDEIFIEVDPSVVIEMNPNVIAPGVLYPSPNVSLYTEPKANIDPLAYPDKEDGEIPEPADYENDGLLK